MITCKRTAVTVLLGAICMLFTMSSASTAIDRTDITDLFSEAKSFFRKANELSDKNPQAAHDAYKKTAMRFIKIIDEGGISNGKLYYNLGNTYFLMGDVGRAILNYRRAARLIPDDPNLIRNLAYARSIRKDKVEDKPEKKVLKTVFFWHYDLAVSARVIIFTVLFALVWIIASVKLFTRRGSLNWLLAISAILCVLVLASVVVSEVGDSSANSGVVVAKEVVARKGNGASYEPSFNNALHSGTEFTVIEKRTGWVNVELPDGRRCWLPENSVELVGKI